MVRGRICKEKENELRRNMKEQIPKKKKCLNVQVAFQKFSRYFANVFGLLVKNFRTTLKQFLQYSSKMNHS